MTLPPLCVVKPAERCMTALMTGAQRNKHLLAIEGDGSMHFESCLVMLSTMNTAAAIAILPP